jgi:hypothetical protein
MGIGAMELFFGPKELQKSDLFGLFVPAAVADNTEFDFARSPVFTGELACFTVMGRVRKFPFVNVTANQNIVTL